MFYEELITRMETYLNNRISEIDKELFDYRKKKNDRSKPQHSRNLARECCIDLQGRKIELKETLKKLLELEDE